MLYQLILSVVLLFGTASAYAALPELPRVYVDTTMPSTSVTKTVCASGCDYTNDLLQKAIDDAQLGTTILLEPGVTYTPLNDSGFILKNKTSGSGWIIIKGANADSALPPPGTRLTPASASVMPKIARPSLGLYALTCELSAHHYRIIGVEFMNPGNADTSRVGQAFVFCYSTLETSLALQSHHILFDRVYIHGPSAGGSYGVKFGILFGGQHEGVIDSTIEDITYSSDAITVASYSGAGPFVIKNNALSSSGENIMLGGSNTLVDNVVPSDWEIRNNYIYKPLKWRDDPAYLGTNKIIVKNHFELKNGQRILIDGNVFENMWPGAQVGFSINITPLQCCTTSNQPWTVGQDITITNNWFKNTAHGIAIMGMDAKGYIGPPTSPGGRYLIKNNLFTGQGGYSGTGTKFQIGNGANDMTISHNTVASAALSPPKGKGVDLIVGNPSSQTGFVFQDNIFLASMYSFYAGSSACNASNLGLVVPGYVWTNNVLVGPWSTAGGCTISTQPQSNGNAYPAGESSIGYVNPAGEDYSLATGSPYKNAASDGTDIGINWPAFQAAQGKAPSTSPITSTTTTSPTTSTTTTTTSPTTTTTTTTTTTPPPTTQTFTLTVSVSGKGTVSGGGTYPAGTNVTLMAIPAAGFRFIGFSGGGCSSNPCTVTVNANTSVAATFKR